ncbi:MAG: AI-2E family transporter [Planctomycetes bacterium]|nr:AI-2E family transporter [Planctomycetota bacterium]
MQPRSLRVAGLTLLLFLFLGFCYALREIFNPFLLSLLFAYILNPIVDYFERLRVRRGVSIFCMYLLLGGSASILVFFAIPGLVNETVNLYNATFLGDEFMDVNGNGTWERGLDPLVRDTNGNGQYDVSYLEKVRHWAAATIERWNERHPDRRLDLDTVLAKVRETLGGTPKEITATSLDLTGRGLSLLQSGVLGTLSVVSYLLLLPIYTFFLLREMPRLRDRIRGYLPGRNRARILRIFERIHRALSSFFRGKLTICLVKGLLTYIGLLLVDVRFPLLFGLIQAGASLVPFLVLIVGLLPALGLVALDHGFAWGSMLGCVVVFLFAEGLEGFVLTPWILGKETGLHPVVLILSLLIGAQLLGLFGLLLAVPVASICQILWAEFLAPQLLQLAAEPPAAEGE